MACFRLWAVFDGASQVVAVCQTDVSNGITDDIARRAAEQHCSTLGRGYYVSAMKWKTDDDTRFEHVKLLGEITADQQLDPLKVRDWFSTSGRGGTKPQKWHQMRDSKVIMNEILRT